MRVATIVAALLLPTAVAACAPTTGDSAATTSEEATPPVSITVDEATEQNARYVELAAAEALDTTDWRDVVRIGCRTNPDSLLDEGPPWRVQTRWVLDNPPKPFVEAALRRLDTLAAQGFRARPWTRPDPPPPNRRSYADDRGYTVTAQTDSRPGGLTVFELTVTSPCADP